MWIVRLALRRPYTFVVMGLTILLLGVFAIVTTPTDIFPEIDIPVVSLNQKVDVGRDLGASVEILNGLDGTERLVVNVPDSLREGAPVRSQGT